MVRTRLLLLVTLLTCMASPLLAQRNIKASTPATLAVTASTVSQGVVLIAWPAVQKAATYEVTRCLSTTCEVRTSPRILAGQPLELKDNLTASGTYLYRVTAFGSNQLPLAQGEVAYQYTAPLTAVLMPAPTGTITPIIAGPAQLTAFSPVPGQIHLAWSPVTNAAYYRVLRSNSGGLVDQALPDKPAATAILQNGMVTLVDGPIDFRWTYSYKVYAVFQSSSGQTLSTSSPVASTSSLPFVQVSGLTYSLVPSTTRIGTLNVTIKWDAVKDVIKYQLWDGTGASLTDGSGAYIGEVWAPSTAVVQREVPPAWLTYTYTVCVGAVYAFDVSQHKTAPCIVIK